ncbi:unnamed protein product [Heterobilharzia americana]|nr:unnamed protein product [Heterobilharzia americana]
MIPLGQMRLSRLNPEFTSHSKHYKSLTYYDSETSPSAKYSQDFSYHINDESKSSAEVLPRDNKSKITNGDPSVLNTETPNTSVFEKYPDNNISNYNTGYNTNTDLANVEINKMTGEYYFDEHTLPNHQTFRQKIPEECNVFTAIPQIVEQNDKLSQKFTGTEDNTAFVNYEDRKIQPQEFNTVQIPSTEPRDLRSHHNYPKRNTKLNSPQPYDSSQITSPEDNQLSTSIPIQSSNIFESSNDENLPSFPILQTSLPLKTVQSIKQTFNNLTDHSLNLTDGNMKYRSLHEGVEEGKFPYTKMNSKTIADDTSTDTVHPVNIDKSDISMNNHDSKGKPILNPGQNPPAPSSSSSQRRMISGATLSFHHISYEVKLRKTTCAKPIVKTVLNDVSGILRPGMNALMGPTGGGKSSLLDVLAGRKDPKFLSGKVLVDGRPQPKNFKCISGYVVQDDTVMGTLTVRENLNFSAALRMTVRYELGLNSVADNKVGTELVRGVSGGERKRTSIGMELITDPPVLFLDEPTTGLDAYMAGQVLKTLKALSKRGRTIIFSIHQPKYSIYKLFDSLTLIYRGQLVYHGPARKEPIRYFGRLGYICENHNNPPDFFMDVIHGECLRQRKNSIDFPIVDYHDTQERIHLVGQQLIQEWQNSEMAQRVLEEVSSIANQLKEYENGNKKFKERSPDISFSAPFFRQINKVCWRATLNLLRDPLASVIQTVVYLFFALSMGTVYFQMNDSLESGIQNRTGLFFFCTLQVIFVNLATIELFIKERVLFIHESSSGYYQVSVYFLSKILCDILPTKVLPIILFMPICYWMAGLQRTFGAFMFLN